MKKLFSESWEGTSIIKRYLRLLINGRQVKVRFLNALEMEDIFEDRESPEKFFLRQKGCCEVVSEKINKLFSGWMFLTEEIGLKL